MTSDLKIGHYILGKMIQRDMYSIIREGTHELTGDNVAIKVFNKQKLKQARFKKHVKQEIKILKTLDHPNIMGALDVFETDENIYLVTDAFQGDLSSLLQNICRLEEDEARPYFQQIIAGLEYCHANHIAHGDLKPENIILDEKNMLKITGFSLSTVIEGGKFIQGLRGTADYLSPEVASGKKSLGVETDIWSCGVILYEMLVGIAPFSAPTWPELMTSIRQDNPEIPDELSPEVGDLIQKILEKNTSKRIRFNKLKSHPWLRMDTSFYTHLSNIKFQWVLNEINEEIFGKIMHMQFNFEGLGKTKIREAILTRKDYSFVAAYNIMVYHEIKQRLGVEFEQFRKLTDLSGQDTDLLEEKSAGELQTEKLNNGST